MYTAYITKRPFIGKQNEIYRYNEQTGNFDLYYQLPGKSLEICCMHLDKGQMWIGTTTDGAYRLQLDKNELTTSKTSPAYTKTAKASYGLAAGKKGCTM